MITATPRMTNNSAPFPDDCTGLAPDARGWTFEGSRKSEQSHPAPGQGQSVLIGESPEIRRVRSLIADYGPVEAPVLVCGETGTGKELAALELHARSLRAAQPFVAINCAALPAELIESELFGSSKGAYTGADSDRRGFFAQADRGTLFLDEIGELPMSLQAKLLRVLGSGTYRPLGASAEATTHVRLIAATNRDLVELIEEGRFREDLYYRISVLLIDMPRLRDRLGDLEQLVGHFVEIMMPEGEKVHITTEAVAQLLSAPWMGNVRELRNALQRTLARSYSDRIEGFALDERRSPREWLRPTRSALTCAELVRLLLQHHGRLSPVAADLGVSVRTVQRRIKEYDLALRDFR
jgi:transcriptional regulator with PAS, ATPase and Fis domain